MNNLALLLVVAVVATAVHRTSAQNMNCALIVPPNPLTAQGLATPYQLTGDMILGTGPCTMGNTNQQSFVQGVILDTDTGALSVYNPLVIDAGSTAAVTPPVPVLPVNFVIGIWFGTNANTLRLLPTPTHTLPDSLQQGNCVNGVLFGNMTDLFGQFAYCNAPNFFLQANRLINAGKITVPPLGTAKDGKPCPTTRDFGVIDQDPSDNMVTSYLLIAPGPPAQVAQNTAANRAMFPGAQVLVNPSDNRLISVAIDTAIGCTPWTAPDLADNGNLVPAVGLNELHAAFRQAQPLSQIPAFDPMATTNQAPNLLKVNAYRVGVFQQPVLTVDGADTTVFCQAIASIAPARMQSLQPFLVGQPTLNAQAGVDLFGFLVSRFAMTWNTGGGGLQCQSLLNMPNPIAATFNAGGVVNGANIATVPNMIPASAFAPGGQFFAATSSTTQQMAFSSPVVIGLIAALAAVVAIDLIVIGVFAYRYYSGQSSSTGYSSSSYSSKSAKADAYITGPNDASVNHPMTPVRGYDQSRVGF